MIDIAKADTENIGKQTALQATAATVEKVRRFYNGDMLHSALPDTETTEYDDNDIYIIGFFVGYLAGAQDMETLLNEIELTANADE